MPFESVVATGFDAAPERFTGALAMPTGVPPGAVPVSVPLKVTFCEPCVTLGGAAVTVRLLVV